MKSLIFLSIFIFSWTSFAELTRSSSELEDYTPITVESPQYEQTDIETSSAPTVTNLGPEGLRNRPCGHLCAGEVGIGDFAMCVMRMKRLGLCEDTSR